MTRISIKRRRKPRQFERSIQTSLFQWSRYVPVKEGGVLFDYMMATPNGGSRHIIEAKNLKLSGVSSGFPDVSILLPRGAYHGMFLEIKRDEKCPISSAQKAWIERLRSLGYFVKVGCGIDKCIEYIGGYLNK